MFSNWLERKYEFSLTKERMMVLIGQKEKKGFHWLKENGGFN